MKTREIPTHEWVPFLNDFSRRYAGALVTIEILGKDIGALTGARSVPLVGINMDLVDGGDNEQIEIIVGPEPRAHFMHAIRRVRNLRLAEGESSEGTALQIESEDGLTTLLRVASGGAPNPPS